MKPVTLLLVFLSALAIVFALPTDTRKFTSVPIDNWGHTANFGPQYFVQPRSEQEIVDIVNETRQRNGRIRMIGSGHSWTPLAATHDTMVNLDNYNGVLSLGQDTVTVQAGIRTFELNEYLWANGRSLLNEGWSASFAVAGTFSAGTHGTGRSLGILATQLVAFRLVLADGSVISVDETHYPDIFHNSVNLGMLGIYSTLTIRTEPAFKLMLTHTPITNAELFSEHIYDPYGPQENYIEFWSVSTDETMEAPGVWYEYRRVRTNDPITGCERETEYDGPEGCIDRSYHTFNEEEYANYTETEIFIPEENVHAALREFLTWQEQQRLTFSTQTQLERWEHAWTGLRWVKGDDIWLSPAYGRNTVVMSFGLYSDLYSPLHGPRGWERDFSFFEMFSRKLIDICRKYKGRPHWGKMHWFSASELEAIYPKYNDFKRLRAQLDPTGLFLNPYTESLFTQNEVSVPCPASHPSPCPSNCGGTNINFSFGGMLG